MQSAASIPYVFERDAELLEIIHHVLDLRPVLVAPTALVKTESGVFLHRWQSNSAELVVPCDLGLGWAGIEG